MNANDIRARLEECERMNARSPWSGLTAARGAWRHCEQCGIGCRVSDGSPASRPAINHTMAPGSARVCDGCRYANYCNTARGVFTPARDDSRPVLTFDQWIEVGRPNARQAAAILAGWRSRVTSPDDVQSGEPGECTGAGVTFGEPMRVPYVTRRGVFEVIPVHAPDRTDKKRSVRIIRDAGAPGWRVQDDYIVSGETLVLANGVSLEDAKRTARDYLTGEPGDS